MHLLKVHAEVDGELVEDDVPVVGLTAVEFVFEEGDGANAGEVEVVVLDPVVEGEVVFVAVDVGEDFFDTDSGDGEFVGEVELLGVFDEEGVVFFADFAAVEAVFEGVGVSERCAVGDGEGFAAVGSAELGTFDGVVFAGVAGGRGGGAGCHNVTSFMRHYTRPGVEKKVAWGEGARVA